MNDTQTEKPLHPLTKFQQATVALSSIAMGSGMTINFVVVAPLAREAGLTELQVAGILTLSTLLYTLSIPFWARLADRFGRKRIMIFALFAMSVTNLAFLFGLSAALSGALTGLSVFFLLTFLRAFFGLLSSGLQPASMAAITDATTSATRTAGLGQISAAISIGSIIGPAGAAALAPIHELAPLWGQIAFSALCGLIIAFTLPESKATQKETSERPKLSIFDERLMPHLIFLLGYFAVVGLVQQTLGWFISDRYELRPDQAVQWSGTAFAALAIGMIAVQFGYVARFNPNPRRILPLGLALVAIGYVGADVFYNFFVMCGFFLLTGIGSALAVPSANALGSLSVERSEQGSAAALLSATPPAGFIIGPLLGSGLYMVNSNLPLIASAVAMIVLAVYALIYTVRRRAV